MKTEEKATDAVEPEVTVEIVEDAIEPTAGVPVVTSTAQPPAIVGPTDMTSALISLARDPQVDVEKLKQLIAMRDAEEARAAKKEFDLHFSKLQRKLGPVIRSKQARDPQKGNRLLYSFAPIEAIVKAVGQTINRAGFTWRWPEEPLGNGEKRVFCVASGYGHEERVFFDVPTETKTPITNAVQGRGVSSSYGQRRTFMAMFGIVLDDEDDDAQSYSPEQVVEYADKIAQIQESRTSDELIENYRYVYKSLGDDDAGKTLVMLAHSRRKAELAEAPNDPQG